MQESNANTLLSLTADIVAAHVSNNHVEVGDLPALIAATYGALASAGNPPEPAVTYEPFVPVRKSITPEYLISLVDGTKCKMLKRHLMTAHGLTPDEYRSRYNLPADYPMVAPNYAEVRRRLAKDIGLGRHPQAGRGRRPAAPRQAAAH